MCDVVPPPHSPAGETQDLRQGQGRFRTTTAAIGPKSNRGFDDWRGLGPSPRQAPRPHTGAAAFIHHRLLEKASGKSVASCPHQSGAARQHSSSPTAAATRSHYVEPREGGRSPPHPASISIPIPIPTPTAIWPPPPRRAGCCRSCSSRRSYMGLGGGPRSWASLPPTWTWCVGVYGAVGAATTTTTSYAGPPPNRNLVGHLDQTRHTVLGRRAGGSSSHGHLLRLGLPARARGVQGLRLHRVEPAVPERAEDGALRCVVVFVSASVGRPMDLSIHRSTEPRVCVCIPPVTDAL